MEISILDVTNRTLKKIILRLEIGCSCCGWDECPGDIHHLIPKSKGGTDDHSNLSYLCPNCHRKIHNGLNVEFKTLQEQIGDRWLKFYFPAKAGIKNHNSLINKRTLKNLSQTAKIKQMSEFKEQILNSNIDFSRFGWVTKVSSIIGVSTQKTGQWMFRNMPEFYETCYKRKKNEHYGIVGG